MYDAESVEFKFSRLRRHLKAIFHLVEFSLWRIRGEWVSKETRIIVLRGKFHPVETDSCHIKLNVIEFGNQAAKKQFDSYFELSCTLLLHLCPALTKNREVKTGYH